MEAACTRQAGSVCGCVEGALQQALLPMNLPHSTTPLPHWCSALTPFRHHSPQKNSPNFPQQKQNNEGGKVCPCLDVLQQQIIWCDATTTPSKGVGHITPHPLLLLYMTRQDSFGVVLPFYPG